MLLGSLALTARLLLGGVFVVAGVTKWRAPNQLASALAALAGSRRATFGDRAVRGLGGFELLLGGWLLSGAAARAAALIAAGVLLAMTATLVALARRAPGVGCGCFGEASNDASNLSGTVRNLVLVAGAVLLAAGADQQLATVEAYAAAATVALGTAIGFHTLSAAVLERARLFAPVR